LERNAYDSTIAVISLLGRG